MRYFFDTEFNENVHPIELISAGFVADDGREWYAISEHYSRHSEYLGERAGTGRDYPENFRHLHSCNDWVKANVLPVMHVDWTQQKKGDSYVIGTEDDIKNSLMGFVGLDPAPEFWAYYGAYDWFLLTRMFRGFDKMPTKWPQISYDLHQYAKHVGVHRELPRKLEPVHNALVDARWTKQAFEKVKELRNLRLPVNKEPVWP